MYFKYAIVDPVFLRPVTVYITKYCTCIKRRADTFYDKSAHHKSRAKKNLSHQPNAHLYRYFRTRIYSYIRKYARTFVASLNQSSMRGFLVEDEEGGSHKSFAHIQHDGQRQHDEQHDEQHYSRR